MYTTLSAIGLVEMGHMCPVLYYLLILFIFLEEKCLKEIIFAYTPEPDRSYLTFMIIQHIQLLLGMGINTSEKKGENIPHVKTPQAPR